ncbi:D-alanyl-D-alanine endopeptidase, partial [Paraburkholderia sp. Se-20369]|nr:D-alanyl-D-alanine endopeptidase [Paraburkholderia sp. Se-20369]
SISKLMTAVVARQADRPLDGMLRVTAHDRDTIKFTHSRLSVGSTLSRRDMVRIALMSSENRAAAALSRDYPGGRPAFVAAMNREARRLGMRYTHFHEATGLSPRNVSTAEELARLVDAAARDPLIRRFSTARSGSVQPGSGTLRYVNSDPLVRYGQWPIQLQKTGFINEAGHGVVMRTQVRGRPATIVLLGAPTRAGVTHDAQTIRRWLACSLM